VPLLLLLLMLRASGAVATIPPPPYSDPVVPTVAELVPADACLPDGDALRGVCGWPVLQVELAPFYNPGGLHAAASGAFLQHNFPCYWGTTASPSRGERTHMQTHAEHLSTCILRVCCCSLSHSDGSANHRYCEAGTDELERACGGAHMCTLQYDERERAVV
jgi:hypothetical protein